MMMALIRTSTADGVGTLAFDNYAHRNALSAALIAELIAALAGMREAARVVVLRSIAKSAVWSAGHDIHELSPKGQDPLAWNDPLEQLLRAIGDFPAPVIAMIDGSVWGGACDLVLDCDISLGDEAASFSFVPAKLGLPYNLSGVQRFVTRLPPNVAMEMACTADPVDADRALRVNILNHLVPTAELEARTYAMAKTIAGRHREAIAAFKAQARLLMATPVASPERLEYVERIRWQAYAGSVASQASTEP
jgi:methylmalonyl-CoA decarboxylase